MEAINDIGRRTGQSERLRVVAPFRLLSALLVALATGATGATGATETIGDLRREFNFRNKTTTAVSTRWARTRPARGRRAAKGANGCAVNMHGAPSVS